MNKKVVIISFFIMSNLLAANKAKLKSIDEPVVIIDEQEKAAKLVKKVDEATQDLISRIKKITSLVADFTQTEQDLAHNSNKTTIANPNVLQGKVKLAKPNKLSWEILSPNKERQIYLTNGEKFWHYDKGLEQVVLDKYDSKRVVNSPLYFLLVNVDNLPDSYKVKKIDKDQFTLESKDAMKLESNYTTDLKLKFKSGTNILTQVSFVAAQNKRIIIDLNNVNVNTGINNSVFNFKIPSGVDVINASELY